MLACGRPAANDGALANALRPSRTIHVDALSTGRGLIGVRAGARPVAHDGAFPTALRPSRTIHL